VRHYEGMFILHNREITDVTASPEATVRALVEKVGGEVQSARVWANRKLAYTIDGNQMGTYVLVFFTGDIDVVARIQREVKLSDRCLRSQSFLIDGAPSEEQLSELQEAIQRPGRKDLATETRGFDKEIIDYKNVPLLRRVVSSQGKMFSRKRTGASALQQRKLRNAVMRARFISLLPFVAT